MAAIDASSVLTLCIDVFMFGVTFVTAVHIVLMHRMKIGVAILYMLMFVIGIIWSYQNGTTGQDHDLMQMVMSDLTNIVFAFGSFVFVHEKINQHHNSILQDIRNGLHA